MPIEIRELIIKAVAVTENKESDTKPDVTRASADQEVIVQECIRQILNILKKQGER